MVEPPTPILVGRKAKSNRGWIQTGVKLFFPYLNLFLSSAFKQALNFPKTNANILSPPQKYSFLKLVKT